MSVLTFDRVKLALLGAVTLFAMGFGIGWGARRPAPIPPEAVKHERTAQGLDREAAQRAPQIDQAHERVGQLERELAAAKQRLAAQPRPVASGAGEAGLAAAPELSATQEVLVDQDKLIGALKQENALQAEQLATVGQANEERKAEIKLLAPQDRPRPWSIGAGMFPPQQGLPREIFVAVRRDAGPTFLEALASRSSLTGTRVGFAAGWRF